MAAMLHWLWQLLLGLLATAVGAYTVVPRINARIAEVTGAHEDRRTFRHKLTSIIGLCERMQLTTPPDAGAEFSARIEAERERWRTQLDEHTAWLVDNAEWFALGYVRRLGLRDLAMAYPFAARVVFISEREDSDKFKVIEQLTRSAWTVFAARRGLRFAATFASNLATFRQQLGEIEGLPVPPSSEPTGGSPVSPAPAESET